MQAYALGSVSTVTNGMPDRAIESPVAGAHIVRGKEPSLARPIWNRNDQMYYPVGTMTLTAPH